MVRRIWDAQEHGAEVHGSNGTVDVSTRMHYVWSMEEGFPLRSSARGNQSSFLLISSHPANSAQCPFTPSLHFLYFPPS